jgi:hypothetical protein
VIFHVSQSTELLKVTSAMGCMSLGQVQMWVGIRARGCRPVLHKGTIWSLGIPTVGLSCEAAINGEDYDAGDLDVGEKGTRNNGVIGRRNKMKGA